ncbi:AAA family ATPase [Candidatus Desulfarcum epimagneticum]|uniref:AAA family ATPase n=1 Tax=uncultured Desulfobacteraceae bacterium TaxID=218296 RepID=A0A484HE68_9BACT|nr:AAA family ATPase [uncultured Desulfobacteraceae bacterium]VEN73538.1 AAA family ATPase [uncultured Desulfobacteraceae bacterium]VEN73810.1 AAA family ATPase [uncultured Desulfobacteraceae bacterium]VEN74064.1 AAA family ATPase [uncultured Desulfobacteraceae bacterium]VEN74075.1 AAA family ATPase [uncultured Desulfobacteraceae bacterium]
MDNHRVFFSLKKEPFISDLKPNEMLETHELISVQNRFDYAVGLGGIGLVTGEIGSGKSTALRYSAAMLHPSEYRCVYVVASSGSIIELYRQIISKLQIFLSTNSKALMTDMIRKEIKKQVLGKKIKPVLIIDEASLLRLEVFAELHTITQFEKDSKPWLPVILAGQSNLIDKLMYRGSGPLASRIIARSHLEGLNLDMMRKYLAHHLGLAGVETNLFDDTAARAIHQGSGGLLRKANHLARGALIAAAAQKSMTVKADHVRLASTEIF